VAWLTEIQIQMEIPMTEEEIVCASCRKTFLYTESEKNFLEGLQKDGKISEVVKPKKCVPCRSAFRKSKAASPAVREAHQPKPALSLGPAAMKFPERPVSPLSPIFASVPTSAPIPHGAGCMCPRCGDQGTSPMDIQITPVPAPPAPGAPPAEEIVILVASDFEQLVCREDVVWRQGNKKITIRLADIGPEAMKRAMEKGVLSWWKS
jgi:hypothetical protein